MISRRARPQGDDAYQSDVLSSTCGCTLPRGPARADAAARSSRCAWRTMQNGERSARSVALDASESVLATLAAQAIGCAGFRRAGNVMPVRSAQTAAGEPVATRDPQAQESPSHGLRPSRSSTIKRRVPAGCARPHHRDRRRSRRRHPAPCKTHS